MIAPARTSILLLAACAWAVGVRRVLCWRTSGLFSCDGQPAAVTERLTLHSIRRLDRGDEFISVFLSSGWRELPCRSDAPRGRPPDAARRPRVHAPHAVYRRSLRYEPLEDRRLLAVVTVNTLSDVTNLSDNLTTLREAIFATNLVAGADTIEFAPALTAGGLGQSILLNSGELTITDSLTINGPGTGLLTIDAQQLSRIFHITQTTVSCTISGLNVTGGKSSLAGGGVLAETFGSVTLRDCVVDKCQTSGSNVGGGGVSSSGPITLVGTTISNNMSTSTGGGIRALGKLVLIDSIVSGNTSLGNYRYGGGGIYGQEVVLDHSRISGNSTSRSFARGGGIYCQILTALNNSTISGNSTARELSPGGGVFAIKVTLDHSEVSGNKTLGGSSRGGGIYCQTLTALNNSTISGNSTAASTGGGVYATNVILDHSTVSGNKTLGSLSDGGGVFAKNQISLNHSLVNGNSSNGNGGGLSASSVAIIQSTVSENNTIRHWRGGGIYCNSLTMDQSSVTANSASSEGGGIYCKSSAVIANSEVVGNSTSDKFVDGGGIYAMGSAAISNSFIAGNSATADGGGIYGRGSLTIVDCEVTGNRAFDDGGGIWLYSTGTLTLTRVTISGNQADVWGGGVFSSGIATIDQCDISGNQAYEGGGIYCSSGLTINNSRVTENVATGYNGGGVFSSGKLLLSNSTVSGNETMRNGGGLYCSGDASVKNSAISSNNAAMSGGGIAAGASLELLNSTISQNTASASAGGVWCRGSSATVLQSTIYRNKTTGVGGGVFIDSGALWLDGSIVAGNFAQSGMDATGLLGASLHARFSLIGNNSGSGLGTTPAGLTDANGNLIGGATDQTMIDPKLGLLAENGGPTKTHALLPGSPALNSGALNAGGGTLQFDQRGTPFTRVFGDRVDMGAYERQTLPLTNYVVDTLVDECDGDISSGHLSLREAIQLANGNVDSAQVISIAQTLTDHGPARIYLTHGELMITDQLTIDGPDGGLLTLDASRTERLTQSKVGSRVFTIDDGDSTTTITVSLSGLVLTGGDVAEDGGAILSRENLVITGSTICDNFATRGGGIFSSGPLSLIDSTVSGNTASNAGGGICNNYASIIVSGSTIARNSLTQGGGAGIAVFGSKSNVTITNSVISDNVVAEEVLSIVVF